MSEASSPARPESAQFVEAWAGSLGQVLAQIAGSPIPCLALDEAPAALPDSSDSDLWISGACSGGLRGEFALRLPPAAVLRLAQIFLSEPSTPDATLTPDHREAAIELLRQAGGLVASSLKPLWGEIPLRLEPVAASPSWPPSATIWLRVGEEAGATLLAIQISAALAAALRPGKPDPLPPSTVAEQPALPNDGAVKLDLLMDVELAVTLRFGSRRLLLREVLDLNPGAVVNLDRQVSEPVDMLLDGRLLARGEVVVIDGHYGLRVTEVAPPTP